MRKEGFIYLSHGQAIAYCEGGKVGGSKIILLNAHLEKSLFLRLLKEYLEKEYHLLVIDLPGCGKSDYTRAFDSFGQLAVDIEEVVRRLDFVDSYVIGWFFGAAVAVELVSVMAEAKGCIVLGSTGLTGYSAYEVLGLDKQILEHYLPSQIAEQLWHIYMEQERGWITLLDEQEAMLQKDSESSLFNHSKDSFWFDYHRAMFYFNVSKEFNGVKAGSGRLDALDCPLLVLERHDTMPSLAVLQRWWSAIGKKVCLFDATSQKAALVSSIAHFVG